MGHILGGIEVAWLKKDSSPFEAFAAEFADYADAALNMSGTGKFSGLKMLLQMVVEKIKPIFMAELISFFDFELP